MGLYNAIVKMEQGGNVDGVLQVSFHNFLRPFILLQ